MLLINVEALGRSAFNSPIIGVIEMIEISIVGIVFMQLADSLRRGVLTRSDGLFNQVMARKPAAGHAMAIMTYLAGAAFLVLVIWGSVPFFIDAWQNDYYIGVEGMFTAPVWPIALIIVLGVAVTLESMFPEDADGRQFKHARRAVPVRRPCPERRTRLHDRSCSCLVLIYAGMFVAEGAGPDTPSPCGAGCTVNRSTSRSSRMAAATHDIIVQAVFASFGRVRPDGHGVASDIGLGGDVSEGRRPASSAGSTAVSAWRQWRRTPCSTRSPARRSHPARCSPASTCPRCGSFGYTRQFSVGVVAGSSVLGMLIPPSSMLIKKAIEGLAVGRPEFYIRPRHSGKSCWPPPSCWTNSGHRQHLPDVQ